MIVRTVSALALFFILTVSLAAAQEETTPLEAELARLRQEKAELQRALVETSERAQRLEKRLLAMEQQRETDKAPAEPSPSPDQKLKGPWDAEISLGANLSSGNNDSSRLNTEFKAIRKTEIDKLTFGLSGEVGQNESVTNAQRIEGVTDYQRDFSETWYWYTNAKGEHDDIAGLDYRTAIGPGLGWHAISTDTMILDFEGGPTWVAEKLRGESLAHSIRLRLAEHFEWQFSSFAKLYQDLEFLANAQDVEDWLLNAEIGVESDLTRTLSLRVSAENRYDNQPAPGRLKNDLFLKSSVVYKFK